ncbi:MAG: DUF177 domain-containing protein [Pseudomonadales bacterium]|nr:DUF177 domain-containing protein [Pseudomonadales bacterium]MCP5184876.1 DUF177 domain-containing protein [Pseudomonadales bacterium]
MAPPKPDDATYRELAEAGAVLVRELDGDACGRLAAVGTLLGPISVTLAFQGSGRRPRVDGSATARLRLPCQWCEEHLERTVSTRFLALLACDEAQADDWDKDLPGELEIIVAGTQLDVALLVEDELLLSIPERVCVDDACARRPRASSGDIEVEESGKSPFSGLAELLDSGSRRGRR